MLCMIMNQQLAIPLSNPGAHLQHALSHTKQLSSLNRRILPSATDLAEPHLSKLSKLDAAMNEKRNRMNPSLITPSKAGIPSMSQSNVEFNRWILFLIQCKRHQYNLKLFRQHSI
ncbi:Hypothetical_protein [Hexamita inflata]|uniref:Hypothetical_protein n=1 Tax=Hexamita inflata TaxID=28002 RepID=A0AA86TQE9_9EUKA|nr:Hypothetical protein HINF_LOCUS13109 [Hexamita inflata]